MRPISDALATDLYQLSMLQCYDHARMHGTAVFDLFVRRLPQTRNFFVAAGLAQALELLESLHFTAEDLGWLRESGRLRPEFVDVLSGWHFTGEVHALPEGTIFFPNEPVLRVTAPLGEAQLVESRLLNLLHFQTMIATKAARCMLAAPDKSLVDFGFRRSHSAEAGVLAARAAYLAGFAGTATVEAGRQFGIPLFGTMAHSLVQAIGDDASALLSFARACSSNVVYLLDTYDTESAARTCVQLAPVLRRENITLRGVRIDSGDLNAHAGSVRKILDAGGLQDVTIFASGGLDEYELARLVHERAPIDAFGVGTSLDVSADAPYLDIVYKLVEYDGRPTRKRSEGKATWPGRKQVYRAFDAAGIMQYDTLSLEADAQAGIPLLLPVMSEGKRVVPDDSLDTIRRRTDEQLRQLPDRLRQLAAAEPYQVVIAPVLKTLAAQADELVAGAHKPN